MPHAAAANAAHVSPIERALVRTASLISRSQTSLFLILPRARLLPSALHGLCNSTSSKEHFAQHLKQRPCPLLVRLHHLRAAR